MDSYTIVMCSESLVTVCGHVIIHCYYRWRSRISRWLKDCEEFALKYAPNYPVLYYHLSLINALAKLPEQSRKNFHSYMNRYVHVVCVCAHARVFVCVYVCACVRACVYILCMFMSECVYVMYATYLYIVCMGRYICLM